MRITEQKAKLLLIVIMAVLLLPFFNRSHATSIREVSVDEMLQKSQFVFEGAVTAVEIRSNEHRRIHTYVTLKIQEVIKGEYKDEFITLRFLGGSINGVTMRISDMRVPEQGEHGIYFVESLERLQVNPLFGWSQGHFIVRSDSSGTGRILTNKGLPVRGVLDSTPSELVSLSNKGANALSKGVARDVIVGQRDEDTEGMTVDAFKKALHVKMGPKQ